MSNHQSCLRCNSDFVGPGTNIGSNICALCSGEVHADCIAEIAILESSIEQKDETIAALQATIDRLESDKAALLEACKDTVAWGEAYRDDQGGSYNPMDWHISEGLDEAIAQAEKPEAAREAQ